jgi:hypothetical protein
MKIRMIEYQWDIWNLLRSLQTPWQLFAGSNAQHTKSTLSKGLLDWHEFAPPLTYE